MLFRGLLKSMLRLWLLGLFILSVCPIVLANTLFVPSQYAQIQQAIDVAQAGDTVFVEAGVYDILDSIHMKEKVNLVGAGSQVTVLNGIDEMEVLVYGASHSLLSGFKLKKEIASTGVPTYGVAVYLDNVRQMVIKDNGVVGHMDIGIYLKSSHYNVLENNIVKSIEDDKVISHALSLNASSYNYILDNSVDGFWAGIFSYYGKNNKIEHNFVRKVEFLYGQSTGGAIHLFTEKDTTLLHNTCLSMTQNVTPGGGLTLEYPLNVQVNNCLIYGKKHGLYVSGDLPAAVSIQYSDIKGEEQDVVLSGSINPVYGSGVLFLPPKVNLGSGALYANSPCRNAGDPGTPHDPDGSIADIGAFYYVLPSSPPVPNIRRDNK